MDKVTGGSKVGVALLLVGSVGAIGVACYLYLTHGIGVLSAINEGSMYVHVDFWIWWSSANALFEGGSIYHGTGAPARSLNAPIRTVLISPVALLEPLVAYRAFVLLSVATAVGYLSWTARETGMGSGRALVAGAGRYSGGPSLSDAGARLGQRWGRS